MALPFAQALANYFVKSTEAQAEYRTLTRYGCKAPHFPEVQGRLNQR